MKRILTPVRFPLNQHSKQTLREAISIAEEHDAHLTILHVDLYHDGRRVHRRQLKRAVEDAFGPLPHARFVVRSAFLVEETILNEVVGERADAVVIGKRQVKRWRSMIRDLIGDPNIERFLRDELDCQVITVG